MIQLQHHSNVAACSGYTSRDSVYWCACARTRVLVQGAYYIIHALQQHTAAAVVVLQLLALSAACLPYAKYQVCSSIESSVLLLLYLNRIQ